MPTYGLIQSLLDRLSKSYFEMLLLNKQGKLLKLVGSAQSVQVIVRDFRLFLALLARAVWFSHQHRRFAF